MISVGNYFRRNTASLAALCLFISAATMPVVSGKEVLKSAAAESRYLLFQIFVAGAGTDVFPPQGEIASFVNDIVGRIGTTGGRREKLGFVVGPLSFNQNDEEILRLIRDSFKIAVHKNVAVAFHIDLHMFWDKRRDLYGDKNNIEWLSWNGTPSTGARLDWGPEPTKAPAQMCFNSPAIKAAVAKRAALIGGEIKRQVEILRAAGKEELFAGVIAGWETRIARDFATDGLLGYHALRNRGLSAKYLTTDFDAELVKVVKDFSELWASDLAQAGVPTNKIYCHIAFTSQGLSKPGKRTYAQEVGFATPEVAFSKSYRPGFSTYPEEGAIEEIYGVVAKHGNPPWISAEGTNIVPSGVPGEPTMESYLGKMFSHGAVAVNIFSWGMGGEAQKNNMFRRVTENGEAISAYRKFLAGGSLKEQARSANAFSPARFQKKVQTIQSQLPSWVERTRRPDIVQPMMIKLDGLIKGGKFEEANLQADEVLKLLGAK